MYDIIFKRKSVRKYNMSPLPEEKLALILDFSKQVKPLFSDIATEFAISNADEASGLFSVKAPHYLCLYSKEQENHYLNAGFVLQQMDLFLSSIGLGSCWLGMAKPPEKKKNGLSFIMMLAFGESEEELYRADLTQFKRNALDFISDGNDERLEAARLAPSATNSQPWFFVAENGIINCYRQKLNPVKAVAFDRLNTIDMGIALCHLWVASEEVGKSFSFKTGVVPDLKGYIPIGRIE